MKTNFPVRTLLALAVTAVSLATGQSQSSVISSAPPASGSVLPPEIQPGTPAAEVLKLTQAGVDESVIQTYISNSASAFNLTADKIIALSDAGVPGDLVNAMIDHDKSFLASLPMSAQPDSTPATPTPADTSSAPVAPPATAATLPPPPAQMTVNYFYDNLSPYGAWVDIEGYGRCWRPNVTLYDASWRPYCDRGHWVYSDCGWYWDSDYSWGVTFHYGRWFNSPRYGWCWWPDTVFAPSWVTWRSDSSYCGWAPLPPLAVYRPGIGFFYRGSHVAIGFDFGLASSCYTFVPVNRFCSDRPRYYCVPSHQVNNFYSQTTVINNYNIHNQTIVNNGVSVTVIGSAARHPIQPVAIGTLMNREHHGWRGAAGGYQTYGSANRLNSNNHSGNGTVYQQGNHENRRDADSSHHGYNRNPGTDNGNHTFRSSTASQLTSTTAGNDHNRPGSRQDFRANNNNPGATARPGSTVAVAPSGNNPAPATSANRNEARNNWPNRDNNNRNEFANGNRNQLRQPYQPTANQQPTMATPVPRREYSRPDFRPNEARGNSTPPVRSWSAPVQNPAAVTERGPRREYSRPEFNQSAPRMNSAPSVGRSWSAPAQNQPQHNEGRNRGGYASNR